MKLNKRISNPLFFTLFIASMIVGCGQKSGRRIIPAAPEVKAAEGELKPQSQGNPIPPSASTESIDGIWTVSSATCNGTELRGEDLKSMEIAFNFEQRKAQLFMIDSAAIYKMTFDIYASNSFLSLRYVLDGCTFDTTYLGADILNTPCGSAWSLAFTAPQVFTKVLSNSQMILSTPVAYGFCTLLMDDDSADELLSYEGQITLRKLAGPVDRLMPSIIPSTATERVAAGLSTVWSGVKATGRFVYEIFMGWTLVPVTDQVVPADSSVND